MKIEFSIDKNELIEALQLFSPFIVVQKKDEDDEDDETTEITLPEPYFCDKVTFLLYKTHACLSVLTKEGVRVERTCSIESNCEDLSFCVSHAYLLQEANKTGSDNLRFIEDRFFGFYVYDGISNNHLFDIEAQSVSKQLSIHPKTFDTLYPHTVGIEHDTFLRILKEFGKYTTTNRLRPYVEDIWFSIQDGICKVVASTGAILRQEIFRTNAAGSYSFTIPGKFAARFYTIIAKWDEYTCQQISYNDKYLRLYNFNREGCYSETIEVPLNKSELPDLSKVLGKRNITNYSSLKVSDFRSTFRMINTMCYKEDFVIMHFFNDHVNLYNKDDVNNKTVFEFRDTIEGDGEFVVKLNQKCLESILDEIHTDNVVLMLIDNSLMYIYNEDEPLFDNIIRVIGTAEMQDKDKELLERGDKEMESHSGYVRKYLSEQNETSDNDDENDAEDDCDYATAEEMKAEAIERMKAVIDYTDIIDFFEEEGLPQVYEAPFGASYALEEEEIENVRKLEKARNILVWGVIRCNMQFNRQEVIVDCMLHVSQNKDDWEQERTDLFNGYPFVYTSMKEFPVTDQGHINIYKSEGGTLLRK